jgi:peptidoglycan/xylan/chitin deacetylase (PgdA/CDA1 family)
MMTSTAILTTSWDDGHPLDHRLADLLDRYGISGTFYIPRKSQLATLSEAEIANLSQRHEIGGHTLDHLALTTLPNKEAKQQIRDCKKWVADVTGRACRMFCPPLGKFNTTHTHFINEAGYLGLRSVEFLQTTPPQALPMLAPDGSNNQLWAMPTTIQSHPHARLSYLRNALKRRRYSTAFSALINPHLTDWTLAAERMVSQVIRQGGVFHLWGHSWEIDEHDQWEPLERVLSKLGQWVQSGNLRSMTNAEVCEQTW